MVQCDDRRIAADFESECVLRNLAVLYEKVVFEYVDVVVSRLSLASHFIAQLRLPERLRLIGSGYAHSCNMELQKSSLNVTLRLAQPDHPTLHISKGRFPKFTRAYNAMQDFISTSCISYTLLT